MTLPEQVLVRPQLQIMSDEDRMKAAIESLEKENHSLKGLVIRLSALVIRNVTGKK
jgi:hypothetical protein